MPWVRCRDACATGTVPLALRRPFSLFSPPLRHNCRLSPRAVAAARLLVRGWGQHVRLWVDPRNFALGLRSQARARGQPSLPCCPHSGLAWLADACEVMLLSFLGPAMRCSWGVGPAQESLLTSVVFCGMLAGAARRGCSCLEPLSAQPSAECMHHAASCHPTLLQPHPPWASTQHPQPTPLPPPPRRLYPGRGGRPPGPAARLPRLGAAAGRRRACQRGGAQLHGQSVAAA